MKPPRSLSLVPPQPRPAPFAVVALVTSAGGLEALSAVLRSLPADWPTAVVVAQHLSGQGSTLVNILRRRLPLPVAWVEDGVPLRPGHVFVCPAGKQLELLPDGTCALSSVERTGRTMPLDFFLTSVADSYGERALAVVLTGMGKDGAAGARAVKDAGGIVLVQSEDSAEQPSMPRTAVENGAADLVLPLHELGAVLTRVVGDGTLPRPRSEMEAVKALFAGGGEVGALMEEKDWATTPLGPVHTWPQSLKTAMRIMLNTRQPIFVWWGRELINLYNDAYTPTLGNKHPQALGKPAAVVWREIWHQVGPRALSALAELDRAKTEFFSNVSHEFRTPLTLMLAPLEELLRRRDEVPPALVAELDVAARNARRLLGLVNTLLDFSRIEAGRLRAHFAPTELNRTTRHSYT